MNKVLVTGANGFVAKHLLLGNGVSFIPVVRTASQPEHIAIGDMADFDDWQNLFAGVEVIVHLAARVHQMDSDDPGVYQRENVEVVTRMAKAAVKAGVKRFIFVSSIKVNGEATEVGRPFSSKDHPCPEDAYGRSKALAETILLDFASSTELEVVIIRPPLVYGPGVKANFKRLMTLAALPLPFGRVRNRRDMVSVYNLCDLIMCCIDHPKAANQIFLVSDGRPYSLSELLITMAQAYGKRPLLWPFPASVLSVCLRMLGKGGFAQRLLGDLELDTSFTQETLEWRPRWTLEDTLRKM